jgi:hypothetical protein
MLAIANKSPEVETLATPLLDLQGEDIYPRSSVVRVWMR